MITVEALRRGWRGFAILWLNACVLFLAANLAALLVLALRERPARMPHPFDPKLLRRFFPTLGDQELEDFMRENVQTFQYEPFTQFRERPATGRYVNVHPAGFRLSRDQGPWPPEASNFNVFIFGGSTTFGYGVPDDLTIASYLQPGLATLGLPRRPRVYNFGRGAYYSSQERILFDSLVVAGFVPDLAIFIDGLNDFYFPDDRPVLTPWLRQLVDQPAGQGAVPYAAILQSLPLLRAFGVHAPRTLQGYPAPPVKAAGAPPRYDDPAVLDRVMRRYLANKRLIDGGAQALNVVAAFVWQPVPMYKYDLRYHVRPGPFGRHEYSRYGYPRMAALRGRESLGENFLWCADIQETTTEPLYVDQVHYAPVMSEKIATCIVDELRARRLLN